MLQHFDDVCRPQTPSFHSHSSARVVANGPKRRLRGGELAEHPGGELPEHFGSAWWNYLNADTYPQNSLLLLRARHYTMGSNRGSRSAPPVCCRSSSALGSPGFPILGPNPSGLGDEPRGRM